jgi:hypothetical protein
VALFGTTVHPDTGLDGRGTMTVAGRTDATGTEARRADGVVPAVDGMRRPPTYAVALVVLGGVIWLFAAALYSFEVVSCPTCGEVVVAPGVDSSGYSTAAIRTLAWDDLYANLYVAAIGLLAIAIGLTGFRRGERWAWWAVGVFVLAGILTAVIDELAWGGWFTFLFLGLLPLLGLALSTPSFLGRRGGGT